jgi:trk system potassium uptake protein TrkH
VSEYAKTILRDLGVAIHIPGIMALISIPICLPLGERFMIPAFAACAGVSLVLGQGLYRSFRSAGAMRVRHAMDTAVLAWITISFLGMLPFILGAFWAPGWAANETLLAFQDPWNALFESVSGFTSTGLTVTLKPEELPHALQWWRSFMQWIGAVGVIVLMLSVFHPSGDAQRLFLAEAREKTIVPGIAETVRTIWWIYLLFTVLAVFGLRIAGMNWWHALNYGLTGIATGGFGATDDNIGDFGVAPRLVLLVIIVIGAISFASHYKLLVKGEIRVLWKDRESRLLFALLLAGAVFVTLEVWWFTGQPQWLEGAFHWASALCTAGFQTTDFSDWSTTARLLLIAGMAIGGVAGSTAGGLKLYRISILTEGASERISRMARQPWRLTEHEALGSDEEAIRRRRALEVASILALV